MIRIEGLSTRAARHGSSALRGIDLVIPARKMVALVGPKRAGKATLLAVLEGGHKANSGSFQLDDETIRPRAPRWQQDVAYAGAVPSLPNSSQVWPALLKGLKPARFKRSRVLPQERAEKLLQTLGIWDLAQGKLAAFSKVELWRLALVQALLDEPRCLLLEEPSLSTGAVTETLQLIRPRAAAGTTFLLSTRHDLPSQLFDHILLLNEGKLIKQGHPDALAEGYQLPPQISIPRTSQSEGFLDETIEEGFIWADGANESFISTLPEDISVVDFYNMLARFGLPERFATLHSPSLSTFFMAAAGKSLEGD